MSSQMKYSRPMTSGFISKNDNVRQKDYGSSLWNNQSIMGLSEKTNKFAKNTGSMN